MASDPFAGHDEFILVVSDGEVRLSVGLNMLSSITVQHMLDHVP